MRGYKRSLSANRIAETMKALSKLKYFGGVKQTLENIIVPEGKPIAYAINLAHPVGEHWVAVYVDKWGRGEYFDPRGGEAERKDIINFFFANCHGYIYYHGEIRRWPNSSAYHVAMYIKSKKSRSLCLCIGF